MARMAQCMFAPEPMVEMGLLAEGDHPEHMKPIVARAETCEVAEAGGTWHFTRIGPFETHGGRLRTSFSTWHDVAMHSQWRVENNRTLLDVGAYILGAVDVACGLIGFPPIQQERFHYGYASNSLLQPLSVYDDGECLGGDGVYCQLVEYPARHAWQLTPDLTLLADFIDTRPPLSPALRWYGLAGIFILDPPQEVTEEEAPSLMPMSWAVLSLAPALLSVPLGETGGPRRTQLFDTARPCVSWTSGTVPFVGHVIDAYWHSSPEMVEDIWLIGASPQQLGLLHQPWVRAWDVTRTTENDPFDTNMFHTFELGHPSMLDWRRHVRAGMHEGELLCTYNGEDHLEVREEGGAQAGTDEKGEGAASRRRAASGRAVGYARRTPCTLGKRVTGSFSWTLIGFFSAQTTSAPPLSWQHGTPPLAAIAADLRLTYVAADDARWDYSGYVWPKECVHYYRSYSIDKNGADGHPQSLYAFPRLQCTAGLYLANGLWKGDRMLFLTDVLVPLGLYIFWGNSIMISLIAMGLVICCCIPWREVHGRGRRNPSSRHLEKYLV